MTTNRKDLVTRLARIEGQVAALKRTLESGSDADCTKTLIQVKAAAQGLKRFAEAFAREYAQRCVAERRGSKNLSVEVDTIISTAFSLS